MFDPTTKHHNPRNSFDLYDETRHETWETANSNNMWPLKKPQLSKDDDEPEPEPRWGMNSPHYRSLSPNSRTEAIIRGQKELMEMVRNMPESNYELSLKDLVEHHYRDVSITTEENNNKEEEEKKKSSSKRVDDKKVPVKRIEKVDRGGFYLKVALPFITSGSNKEKKKKKKKESKVSPKPSISDGSVKEKEWWKKSTPLVYKESDDSALSSIDSNGSLKSSISSSSSKSSSGRSRSRRVRSNSSRREKSGGGCWTIFRKSKNQTKRVKD